MASISWILQSLQCPNQGQEGMIIPVVITIFSDRSFTFITKRHRFDSLEEGGEDR